jgi:hypothetical protein
MHMCGVVRQASGLLFGLVPDVMTSCSYVVRRLQRLTLFAAAAAAGPHHLRAG